MSTPTPAAWHPDPTGVFDHRWWDGTRWTEQVAKNGVQSQSAMPGAGGPVQTHDASYVQRQVQRQAGVIPSQSGGGTMFTEPVLVVNQKAKLIELSNQYAVYDQAGNQLGSVSEIGQSAAKKALRLVSNVGSFLTHKLEVRDAQGIPVLLITRPAKMIKSKVIVERPGVGEIGMLQQENAIGKIRFAMVANGQQVGMLQAENWRAWDFAILDHTGTEVARIKKTFEGLARAMFTDADNYVVRIHRPLEDPLLSLVVASALTVDTALKQDD